MIAPLQGLRTENSVNFQTQAVGLVPQGGIGRPFGAGGVQPAPHPTRVPMKCIGIAGHPLPKGEGFFPDLRIG